VRITLSAILVLLVTLSCSPALAWSPSGHQLVGSIADQMLTPNARQHVHALLGYNLRTAATWPDCVRSVKPVGSGDFSYLPDPAHPEYRTPCVRFEGGAEQLRMEDYVKRNWSNCVYTTGRGCHEAYHFADVPVQRDDYQRTYAGTSDHDIVSAITAAQIVLKGGTAPAPFSIKDKKEALLLIAHFVGDLHQPLHVGAVYLDADGRLVDPGGVGGDTPAIHTHGGNSITDGGSNLHSEWDNSGLGDTADATLLQAARALPKTPGAPATWPSVWASETVLTSHVAFQGLSFGHKSGTHWPLIFANEPSYRAIKAAQQRVQVIRAGARLAQLLNATWP